MARGRRRLDGIVETLSMRITLKRALVGPALRTAQAVHERLSKPLALAVFSSDALSSVAYATEEILLILVLAGSAALHFSIPISLCIIGLLVILVLSYRQIIFAYPQGGGAYVVARANLGEIPGLIAAAALVIDYVLTVAVSVAAGIAAVTSAVPELLPHRVMLSIGAILAIMIVNLRGLRESGRVFAVPTYAFIGSLFLMVGVGFGRLVFGSVPSASPIPVLLPGVEPLTWFLLLRAFSSGCAALTGVEVISNGVTAFRRPESRNAAVTMIWMAAILATLFLGITVLTYQFGIIPRGGETLVSQIARHTFGEGMLYYLAQVTTMAVLILAANSSFNGFPRLASILARDGYMPHQMSTQGDRLVFSNGIVILALLSCLLILLFHGDTHALIPPYAVGVFLSFTLSQSGMVQYWFTHREGDWRRRCLINGVGAVATGMATFVIASTKFIHGAWIVLALLPTLILWFRMVRTHYRVTEEQVHLERDHRPPKPQRHVVVIPIGTVDQPALRALDYARNQSTTVYAVHVDMEKEETARVKTQWAQWGCGVPLIVIPLRDHSLVRSLVAYIEDVLDAHREAWVTLVLPEILPATWWQTILHNRQPLLLKASLLFKPRVILTDVPFHLRS
jgi:amino acid transporter